MDGQSFDRFARLLSSTGSRRQAVGALLVSALLGTAAATTEARVGKKRGGKGKGRGRGKEQRRNRGSVRAEALPDTCCSDGNCGPGAGKNLSKCCYEGAELIGANFKNANLGGANFSGANLTDANFKNANLGKVCLVGADLTGAKLGGANTSTAIFCGTRMPDGTTINDSGCEKDTPCCPTCAGACPRDPSNNEPGFCCTGGFCSCGGTCDCGEDCFIVTTETLGGDTPSVESEEVCEPPAGCATCSDSGDRCCTACVGDDQLCASSGPIGGGSIRRR